ncbi:MAG: TrmH family RNA methyltransferase, partial [Pseudomonadota bacterium]
MSKVLVTSGMRFVMFQPDIPQNLGAMMRLSVCFGAPLEVVEPCGFPFSDRAVRKAAMDYGAEAKVTGHADWSAFLAAKGPGRLVLLTTKGDRAQWEHDFREDDHILLGRESAGAPDYVHQAAAAQLRIPLPGGGRSLNVAVAAAVAAAEAERQFAAGRSMREPG